MADHDPITPADCDLRDFAFMSLDVVRLRDSDLVALESAEAFRAAVMLWCASWHQLPAASLPDDDRVLAKLAGYGRVIKEWQKERDGALRGWVKCSDGRLYHPVVAEKAMEAWRGKLERQWRTECARIKKHAQRHQLDLDVPEFDEWMVAGRPQGQPLPVPEDKKRLSQGQPGSRPASVPGEIASKGQGEGQGTGTETGTTSSLRSEEGDASKSRRPPRPKREEVTLTAYLEACRAEGRKPIPPDHHIRTYCRDAGISDEMLQVAWIVFRRKYTEDTKGKGKRYKDWPGTFANAVREGWLKLWYVDGPTGEVRYTSTGLLEKASLDAKARQREAETS